MEEETVLVSACLLGFKCRYDGKDKADRLDPDRIKDVAVVPFCPEVAAGMSIPRKKVTLMQAAEFTQYMTMGVAEDEDGVDVSIDMSNGAQLAVDTAKSHGCTRAILKDGSPSCGVGNTNMFWDKQFGVGITTAMLSSSGVYVEASDEP